MTEKPLIFYAEEDSRTLDVLRKHLFTLDITPDKTLLHASHIESHLRQVRQERLMIIMVSVDSLVIFKERLGMLDQMLQQRRQHFGSTGVISVICRHCAWRETILKETRICSGVNYAPITSGKIDQACLNTARDIQAYIFHWNKAIGVQSDLEELYGPAGRGEHAIGDTIAFAVGDSVNTGKVIYVQADGRYVVQVEDQTDHCIVPPCDVIEIMEK